MDKVLWMVLTGVLTASISFSVCAADSDGEFEAKKPKPPVAKVVEATTMQVGGFECGVNGAKVACDNKTTGLSFGGTLMGNRIQIPYADIITLFDGLGCCESLDVNLVGADVLVDAQAIVTEMQR